MKTINDIYQIAQRYKYNDDYDYIGIRVQDEKYNAKIGHIIDHQSSIWDDGNETEQKLNGICAIDANRIKEQSQSSFGGYYGQVVIILGSNNVEYGEDQGEIIMRNAKIIDIIED